jgi:hypothetical protein
MKEGCRCITQLAENGKCRIEAGLERDRIGTHLDAATLRASTAEDLGHLCEFDAGVHDLYPRRVMTDRTEEAVPCKCE